MLKTLPQLEKLNLAIEPQIRIGDISITPVLLEISVGDRCVSVEPRVMQVLIVLAEVPGRVVSRAELVERCWDGRFVGDNAIQRVISRIRHLAASFGGFEIETISKLGYRLCLTGARPAEASATTTEPLLPPATAHFFDRRLAIGGFAAAAGAGTVAAWHVISGADAGQNPSEAMGQELVEKARAAQLMGLAEQNEQAIAYLKRATELSPRSAEAWGLLARSYAEVMEYVPEAALPAVAEWSRSSANSALALEPNQVEARLALAAILPNFHRWATKEAELRSLLARHGSHPGIESTLGFVLCDTGRWYEAIGHFRTALAFEPFSIPNQITLARGLWGRGQLAEADSILAKALKLWPRHNWLWRMRVDFLAHTGRPDEALALIHDESARPVTGPDDSPPPYAALTAFAEAIKSRTPEAIVQVSAFIGTPAAPGPLGHHPFYAMALGLMETEFEILEAFFFGGAGRPPPTPLSRRKTSFLFSAEAKPMRTLPRFDRLIDRLTLRDYWRATRTRPDLS